MIRLLTLGCLAVERPGGSPVPQRPRLQGLALLARLAAAGPRGISRDKVVGCFWPDRDDRRARHSLSQTLHRLRADLGADGIVTGTRILALNPECVTSDLVAFEDAVRARDAARIVELYGGPFLDGVFLDGATEWQRWVDDERQRLAELHARCVREIARDATSRGEHRAAAALWRRLTAADPLDGDAVLSLARSLDAAGEHATALREVRAHQEAVRDELGTDVGPELRRFLDDARPVAAARKHDEPTVTELCARARQCIHSFTAERYAEGLRCLERALAMDPRHGEAHVTLGSLLILLSQADPTGGKRARGVRHCQRAIELEPDLYEPYLWLGCAAMLDERFDDADAWVDRGRALEPDLYFSHYFAGWTGICRAFKTGSATVFERCLAAFERSLRMHPADQHALIPVAQIYAFDDQHDLAEMAMERALAAERSPAVGMETVGALTVLGTIQLHAGRTATARATLGRARAEYADAPQLFAPYVNALTLCSLGDVGRVEGRYDEAVAHYARGLALLEPTPALIGAGYLAIRLYTRLAAAYHRLRMRREELRSARAADELTRTREGRSFNWCWDTSEGQLHYDWAVYHATRGDGAAMRDAIASAAAMCWRETSLVEREPAFGAHRSDDVLRRLLDDARARPPFRAILH